MGMSVVTLEVPDPHAVPVVKNALFERRGQWGFVGKRAGQSGRVILIATNEDLFGASRIVGHNIQSKSRVRT